MITSLSLNVESGEWSVNGQAKHPLPIKRAAILGLLLEKSPDIVTKREFEARVWNGRETTLENIQQQIHLLRRHLHDAGSALDIQALRGGRYRLVEPSDPQP